MVKNVLSIDLESFVHGKFFPADRKTQDNRFIVHATEFLLDLFETYKTKTTFFVVAEIYEWYPELIEKIEKRGHEIAYHTHEHVLLHDIDILRKQLILSKQFLDKYKPRGFRAPQMYLKREYLSLLHDFGFTFDSSVYGYTKKPQVVEKIDEYPVSTKYFLTRQKIVYPNAITTRLLTKGIPYGSGLSIGLLKKFTQNLINNSNKKGIPAILFVHPWQFFDTGTWEKTKKRFNYRQLLYSPKVTDTIEYLLSQNKFVPFREVRKR